MTRSRGADLFERLSQRIGGAPRFDFTSSPLRVVPDLEALTHVPIIRPASPRPPAPGEVWQWAAAEHVTEEVLRSRLAGRIGGVAPPGHSGEDGASVHALNIARVVDAAHAPEFGAIILPDGSIPRSSISEALYITPTLVGLPYVVAGEDGFYLRPPLDAPTIEQAAVFMAWGGRYNYGHFLLDCLPSLMVLAEAGLLKDFRPVSPVLKPWQRDLIGLMLGGAAVTVDETSAPLLLTRDLVFASSMDHFLHAPNRPLEVVRERILSAATSQPTGARRIYLSRRGDAKRRMLNEPELETALRSRGFTIVRPGTLPVEQQIALFRDAETIVAPTGASLANSLFCGPGAQVFEIQPSNFTGIWVRAVCHFVGAHWHGYFAPSPVQESRFYVEGVPRPGTLFGWRTPLDGFLAFLDDRL